MSVIIDLIGSVVIAGLVILMGMRFNQTIVEASHASKAGLNVQESLVDIVQTIEYDFRKIGYGLSNPATAIVVADSEHLQFRADMVDTYGRPRPDGIIDVIDWYIGPKVHRFPNDSVRVLYRKVNNGTPVGAAGLGVTQFKLRYLDQDGNPTNVLSQMWIIETTLRVESIYKVQDQVKRDEDYARMGFAAAFWRQTRLASRNIKRHG
jgi:hypothetical protein